MTPALKAMVEAMVAEMERLLAATDVKDALGRLVGMDARNFTIEDIWERVARAGLVAIREPTEGMLYPGVHPCELEARLPNDPPHCYSEYHLAWNTAGLWRAMVAEILEPTPAVIREGE